MNPGPLAHDPYALPIELSRLDKDFVEIRAEIRMLASGREMDPDHISLSQGCRNFQLYARLDFRY